MSADSETGPSPELRTALFYLSFFAPPAVLAVLSGLWFASEGLSSEQIGIVNAVPLFLMLVLTIVVGRIADRATDWSRTIMICALGSAACAGALFLVHGFLQILLVWTAMVVLQASMMPVIDAAAMRLTARRGSDFGRLRACGTLGYLIVLVATGYVALWWGPGVFLPLFVGLAVLRGLLALQLPRFRAAEGQAKSGEGATRLRQVMKPWFVMPLAGWAIIYGTHTIINAFMGLMWRDQGIGVDLVGLLIAIGAVGETLMFFLFRRMAIRFRARTLILVSAIVTVLRWAAMAFEPGLPWLFLLQALHGISYGMGFLACVTFIARWTSEDIAAEAQGFFVALQQAMAVVSLYGFGWLMGHVGPGAWWGAVIFAALGTAAIWWSWRLPQPDGKIA